MDGLTVWVNHPTLENANPFEVADVVTAAVQAKHAAIFPTLTIGRHRAHEERSWIRYDNREYSSPFTKGVTNSSDNDPKRF